MKISLENFKSLVEEIFDNLDKDTKKLLNNVAILVDEEPTKEQLKKTKIEKGFELLGLFEGFSQGKKLNFGPVLPDKITLFKKSIAAQCENETELKKEILKILKHEIAHHLGSDEKGAIKASNH